MVQSKKIIKGFEELPEGAVFQEEVDRIFDPDQEEIIWFHLKKGEIDFKIGLSDILLCLKFAEEQGEVPPLPKLWWAQITEVYPKGYSFLPE